MIKLIFKEWLKNKKAFAMLVGFFILQLINILVGTRMIILITKTLENPENFKSNMITLVSAYALMIATGIGITYFTNVSNAIMVRSGNADYTNKLLKSDVEMFTKYSVSNISVSSEGILAIRRVGHLIVRQILNAISIIAKFIAIISIGGKIIALVVIFYLIGIILIKCFYNKIHDTNKEIHDLNKDRRQQVENIVNGFNEVRTFNNEEYHQSLMSNILQKLYDIKMKKVKYNIGMNMAINFMEIICTIILIVSSITPIKNGILTVGQTISMITLLQGALNPLLHLLDFLQEYSEMCSSIPDYCKIMNYPNKGVSEGNKSFQFNHEIQIKDISFGYENNNEIIRDINMSIKKGQKVGICGVSGGGKSTLFKLLNRFYDPKDGSITVDGVDIKDIKLDDYRSHISTVHQDTTIFPMSIMENIRYAQVDASDEEVIEASRKANLYEFVDALPDKFNTEVGPRGLKLSGGQRQRIALARLFLVNPEIILLDEATSALDNNSETFIQDEIMKMEGKTIIAIAHRLSTIKDFDVIYVLDKNGIVESGNHQELIEKDGAYAALNK